MIYFCCNERRREAVKEHPTLNGIDYLEVLDRDAPTELDPDNRTLRQRTLLVHCFKAVSDLKKENVRIEGGVRITAIKVLWAFPASDFSSDPAQKFATLAERNFFLSLSQPDQVLVVRTDSNGDFSTYRLSLQLSPSDSHPPLNFDPQLSAVDFSFKVECPGDFDCQTEKICPPEEQEQPEINYLAKDYASFRQLMLDRLSVLLPQWQERNPADVGVTLVELLAYVGDRLSYQQDAIATEAYLGTAHHRVSVRRHARLVDYFMDDGCNARVWVHLKVQGDVPALPQGTQLLTAIPQAAKRIPPDSDAYQKALLAQPEVFETTHDIDLYPAHNELNFYTWGDRECCLPQGSTRATLENHYPNLKPGDVLIFAEAVGPNTGQRSDADPTHRHAVRLTKVTPKEDPLGGRFLDSPNNDPVNITEIEWHTDDALPFPLCISAIADREHGEDYQKNVSIALGNIALADHGRTLKHPEALGAVPQPTLVRASVSAGDRCQPPDPMPIPPRFRPHLQFKPLTQAAAVIKQVSVKGKRQPVRLPFDPEASATAAFQWQMSDVFPAISLTSHLGTKSNTWNAQRDLLNSRPDATDFVVEVEEEGTAYLRFGDDTYGLRPNTDTTFEATYRVGNGTRGNVGAEAIAHIVVTLESLIEEVRNPMPASGGVDPEAMEDLRQKAPSAFRIQERAVTPDDYAEVTQRHPQVQKAAATLRWTGSWYTVFVTVDRLGGLPVDTGFKTEIRKHLEKYRMAGYDLEVDAPRFVSLELEMTVCVLPDYFRSNVKAALLEAFSNRLLPDGRRGFFHPDNFTFGQPVYLSRLYAIAQAVPGVSSVNEIGLKRRGSPKKTALHSGKLELNRLEIARLDNDPNFPENGLLAFTMQGGK
jgi:hypothetical protein